MASPTAIPPEALDWLTGSDKTSLLLVGSLDQYGAALAQSGHLVTMADPDSAALTAIAVRRPWIHVVAAKAESLPFDPGCFDLVISIQNFHTFAPGLALGEWARVLKPQGRIGLAYLTRDDSVPWVKKVRRIVQGYLPDAMTSDQGVSAVTAVKDSAFFPKVETLSFRLWIPSSRIQLQDSARQALGADQLQPNQLTEMLNEIGQLYDEYARVPDPLLLPYQIQCWRAIVDQTELTSCLIPDDDGLSISLS